MISKKNRKARLEYAEARVLWRDKDWDRVYFSDESKYSSLGLDGRQFVRRVAGTDLILNVLEMLPNLEEEAFWFGGCFHLKELVRWFE